MLSLLWSSQPWRICLCLAFLSSSLVRAISLDVSDTDSIKAAAAIVAADMMTYYTGDKPGGIPGMLPYPPYYWWESGAMWGSLIHYWHYTGDTTYNNLTTNGILFQVGSANDFEPSNETLQLGNDDQAFWGMTAMAAAEYNFPNPPASSPQWLALAQAVFNRQVARWDTATCNGGIRWQIFYANGGYDYKNSISNGALFNIAARLAKYTGNVSYADWAETIWDWELDVLLIQPDNGYNIYDGTTPSENCTSIDHLQWSYELGVHLLGAATMWNITNSTTWYDRTQGLLDSVKLYMRENAEGTSDYIMWEAECEAQGNCDTDQLSFKGYLARWMAATTKVAPWTYNFILPRLQASALAAASVCTGGTNGTECGFKWYTGAFDGLVGPGQQICALEVIQGLLINQTTGVVTSTSGGTSNGSASAGTGMSDTDVASNILDITSGDRAGAWVLTALFALMTLGGGAWVCI